ncbi:YciI family protein [Pseudonocardia nigra]|uniref:YciI family protein n=1 Tax=Pseudonocardia nigra TaxID=1921578 RepID=UPI001FE24E93|nr:YciI family protein [Pseudonocardia nigra]
MLLIWSNPENWEALPPADRAALADGAVVEHATVDADLIASGELIVSAALADPVTTRTVRVRDGATLSTDGPFAEAKEHLVGYYMVECESLERATEIAARIPDARWERVEIRPAMDIAGLEM